MTTAVGRYAPSPTGDLHLGNLRTALLAWLQARLQGGGFLLRMEDLDTPRVVAGSADQLLRDLEWLGIDWDGPVVYQSKRQDLYQTALDSLQEQGLIYPCFCSRKELREAASAPHGATLVYPGTCASLSQQQIHNNSKLKPPALRVRVNEASIQFIDQLFGLQKQELRSKVGDFVVKRADQLFAYHLAVVVDDLDQGVTDVVRGSDLLSSTPQQRYLADILQPAKPAIRYWHVPLLADASGQRMAKRDGSASATQWRANQQSAEQLVALFTKQLGFLKDAPPLSAKELLEELTLDSFTTTLQHRDSS